MQKLLNRSSQNSVDRWHMGHGKPLNGNLDPDPDPDPDPGVFNGIFYTAVLQSK